jgi:hypothetical protein
MANNQMDANFMFLFLVLLNIVYLVGVYFYDRRVFGELRKLKTLLTEKTEEQENTSPESVGVTDDMKIFMSGIRANIEDIREYVKNTGMDLDDNAKKLHREIEILKAELNECSTSLSEDPTERDRIQQEILEFTRNNYQKLTEVLQEYIDITKVVEENRDRFHEIPAMLDDYAKVKIELENDKKTIQEIRQVLQKQNIQVAGMLLGSTKSPPERLKENNRFFSNSSFAEGIRSGFDRSLTYNEKINRKKIQDKTNTFLNRYTEYRNRLLNLLEKSEIIGGARVDDFEINRYLVNINSRIKNIRKNSFDILKEAIYISALSSDQEERFVCPDRYSLLASKYVNPDGKSGFKPAVYRSWHEYYSGKFLFCLFESRKENKDETDLVVQCFLTSTLIPLQDHLRHLYLSLDCLNQLKLPESMRPDEVLRELDHLSNEFDDIIGVYEVSPVPVNADDVYEPKLHDSILTILESENDYFIKNVLRNGYRHRERVLRKALVEVQN